MIPILARKCHSKSTISKSLSNPEWSSSVAKSDSDCKSQTNKWTFPKLSRDSDDSEDIGDGGI